MKNQFALISRDDPLIKDVLYGFGSLGPIIWAPSWNKPTDRQTIDKFISRHEVI